MRWIHLFALAALLAVAVAGPAIAQTGSSAAPSHPEGWWGSVGGGISGLRFACADCGESQPVYEAPAAMLAVGKSIGTKVAIGVEFGAAFPANGEDRVVASTLSGMARCYPSSSPFFLKFAIGLSRARLLLTSDGQTQSGSRNGAGISFGAGYDFRVGRSVALTTLVGWYMNAIGDVGAGDTMRQNVSWNTWSVGVGLTFY